MSILAQIVATKQTEVAQLHSQSTMGEWRARAADAAPARDFLAALRGAPPLRLIAEVKKASPSQGVIRADFEPCAIAQAYQAAGAQCISVLTDETYFQGSLDYLAQVRDAVTLPLLRKDFIIDPIQVWQARACGADAVLLIAECLDKPTLQKLHHEILEAGMIPLVECYAAENLDPVLQLKPQIIGVNNRDLNTFQVDLQHSIRLRSLCPDDILFVSESGIHTRKDVQMLEAAQVDAMLVGQSLCQQPDVETATRQLIQDCHDR